MDLVAAAGARVVEVGRAAAGGARARHRRRAGLPRLPVVAAGRPELTAAAGAPRTAVHRRHASGLTVERSDAGAVELADDLVAGGRPGGAPSSAETTHRRRGQLLARSCDTPPPVHRVPTGNATGSLIFFASE